MVVKLFSFKYSTASCYSPLDFREKFYFNSFSFKGSISNSRWFFLLSWTVFPSDKEFIKHLKLLKKKAYKTLSQFFGSSFDDDDTASSAFLGDVNEDMCYGLPYTPLGWCIQDFFKFHFKSLQKSQIGLLVKGSLRDSTHDKCAQDFWGYSRLIFSKDRRLLNHLKTRGIGNLTFQTDDNEDNYMTEVHYNDMLLNNSNHFSKLWIISMG